MGRRPNWQLVVHRSISVQANKPPIFTYIACAVLHDVSLLFALLSWTLVTSQTHIGAFVLLLLCCVTANCVCWSRVTDVSYLANRPAASRHSCPSALTMLLLTLLTSLFLIRCWPRAVLSAWLKAKHGHTSYLSFILHGQQFWVGNFTPQKQTNKNQNMLILALTLEEEKITQTLAMTLCLFCQVQSPILRWHHFLVTYIC